MACRCSSLLELFLDAQVAYLRIKPRKRRLSLELSSRRSLFIVFSKAAAHLPGGQVVDSPFRNIPNPRNLMREVLWIIQGDGRLPMQATHTEGRSSLLKMIRNDKEPPRAYRSVFKERQSLGSLLQMLQMRINLSWS